MDPDEFHSTGLPLHSGLVLGKALFDFDGQADNELTFKVLVDVCVCLPPIVSVCVCVCVCVCV